MIIVKWNTVMELIQGPVQLPVYWFSICFLVFVIDQPLVCVISCRHCEFSQALFASRKSRGLNWGHEADWIFRLSVLSMCSRDHFSSPSQRILYCYRSCSCWLSLVRRALVVDTVGKSWQIKWFCIYFPFNDRRCIPLCLSVVEPDVEIVDSIEAILHF